MRQVVFVETASCCRRNELSGNRLEEELHVRAEIEIREKTVAYVLSCMTVYESERNCGSSVGSILRCCSVGTCNHLQITIGALTIRECRAKEPKGLQKTNY